VVNPTDNTASFAYIVKVYTASSPRTFNEAKGLVMNDYQAWLEEQWIKDLRKKYPVSIDQKVLADISK
jgi:peptidyl-prolyl cis-trans isomerase SurA